MPSSVDLLAVFNALPGAYLLLTPALVIEAVSDAYLTSFFTTRQQLVGQDLFDAFGGALGTPEEETITNLRVSLQQVLSTGQPHQMPVQHYPLIEPTTGARVERYWQLLTTPIRDAQGMIQALLHSVTDVTAQTQAATALRLSQAREQQALAALEAQRSHLQEVLLHLPAQIATYRGPDYVYDFVNTRYTKPLPSRRYLGQPIREVLPEVAAQGILAVFDHVYHSGEPYHLPEQELWLDGQGTGQPQQLYLDFFLHPLRDAEGNIYGLLDFSYDVTALVRARQQGEQLNDELEARVLARTREVEAARQAAEAQQHYLRHIFEQAPVAICLMRGPQAVVELLNQRGAALVGSTPAQVIGHPIRQALPALNGQGFEALYARVLQGETLVFNEMPITFHRAQTGQSDHGYYHHTYQPWREETGAIVGVINIGVEVTEQVRARQQVQQLNEELREANSQLRRTNVDLDNFIYSASHDLKAPISNIEGLLQLLNQLLPPATRAEAEIAPVLQMMQVSVERFKRTIAHLTDLTKLQLEFAQPAAAVSLARVVEDVRHDLLPLLEETCGQLTIEIDDCQPLVFSEKNLRLVVYNLLSNAFKYRHPARSPRVRLSCAREQDQLLLRVHDNGLGLNQAQQAKLYGLFQRLHTHVEGTGIGLYMVKKIVENAGGTLSVASEPGQGTTFTVAFPPQALG
ncbi:PAS domain-containing sensor histidine kinase [Hymenobacter volaticus]|uniref:histidine kinase n=1 Tax=Hymenobacter volaticus TaxID=2932254 RepID=A0ABY4GEB9_9BACT|nr:PAS domain-containing protein [Hymenobacter volaticus]UOQ69198.1 PAS domain-containing sensor histidine kinase [Hymenobacter volaticus]